MIITLLLYFWSLVSDKVLVFGNMSKWLKVLNKFSFQINFSDAKT